MLVLCEPHNIVDLQNKPLETFGQVLALVGYELSPDALSEMLLGGFPDLGTFIRKAGYPTELASRRNYSTEGSRR